MNDIVEKQRQRAEADRRTDLLNSLYRMGIYETPDGRKIEDVSLFTLEHVHINEKCRMTRIKQVQGELK